MTILSIQTVQTGLVGVLPSLAYIATNDTIAAVEATGYLNREVANGTQFSLPCIAAVSTMATPTAAPQVGWYQVSHVAPNWSLIAPAIDVPVPFIVPGNIQAGLNGTAGAFISYPGTPNTGYLELAARANAANYVTLIQNSQMGQASTISIPDPLVATASFAVAPAALVNGNLIKAQGIGGLIQDAGFAASAVMQLNVTNTMGSAGLVTAHKVSGTEATNAVTASGMAGFITTSALTTAGGASYAITWTNTLITATSVILLTIAGGTNPTQNVSLVCTPGSGTATLTIYNNTAATALNGTIIISYLVM